MGFLVTDQVLIEVVDKDQGDIKNTPVAFPALRGRLANN